jgi:hypothetical protein
MGLVPDSAALSKWVEGPVMAQDMVGAHHLASLTSYLQVFDVLVGLGFTTH